MESVNSPVEQPQAEQSQPQATKRTFRPFLQLLGFLNQVAPELRPNVQKSMFRAWYQFLNASGRGANIATMNYGYAALPDEGSDNDAPFLDESDTDNVDRYGLALYHHIASAVDLQDKDVLEVGCGRGGGAAFVNRCFKPRSMTGIDFSEKAIAHCYSRYHQEGITFLTGDAENLSFLPASFDAVVNVESSHCYPNFERFLQEVERVLRPQGYLLFADFRSPADVPVLRQQFQQSGLVVLQEENISANVLRALDLNSEQRMAIAQRDIPAPLRNAFNDFAGVRGSQIYHEFESGELEYLRFALQKE